MYVLLDELVPRSPAEREPFAQLVFGVVGLEVRGGRIERRAFEVADFVAQKNSRHDVANLTVPDAFDALGNRGVVAHLRSANYGKPRLVGKGNKLVVDFSKSNGVYGNRLFGENVFACFEALFDVAGAEDGGSRQNNDVGVGLHDFVDSVKPDERRFGAYPPRVLFSERFEGEVFHLFRRLFNLLWEGVARGDEFYVGVSREHVAEGVASASAAADDCHFDFVGVFCRRAFFECLRHI